MKDSYEKRIFNQQSPPSESDGNQTVNSKPVVENTQETLILMIRLNDWQSRQNNITVYNIP